MNLKECVERLTKFAPLQYAESWDNVGLLVEPTNCGTISKILLTNDLTTSVLDEAIQKRVQMIVSYHPPIFSAFKRLNSSNVKQRLVLQCVENGIAVFSHHTAIDAKLGGVNDWLASCVGEIDSSRPLTVAMNAPPSSEALKLVTFVPLNDVDKVRQAMSEAGAGIIGGYSCCSFKTQGVGSFLGGKSTNPTVGARGQLEFVDECKLEMVTSKAALPKVIAALKAAHPYDEVAFDLIDMAQRPTTDGTGAGRLITLRTPRSLNDIIASVKKHIGVANLRVARAMNNKASTDEQRQQQQLVTTIGVCAGSGATLLANVRCDLWLTGEAGHHDVLAAIEAGTSVILCEHSNSERGYLQAKMLPELQAMFGNQVEISVSQVDRDPLLIE